MQMKCLRAESEWVKPAEDRVEDSVLGDEDEEIDGEKLVPREGVLC